MRCILILLLPILLTAGQTITLGQTWNFAEKNALDEIQEHLQKNKAEIEKKAKEAKAKIEQSAKDYKAPNLVKLPRSAKNDIFYPDMKYSLEFDIKDRLGNVVYPKGYTYNITDYVKLPYTMIVIDATDKVQLDWFKKSEYSKAINCQLLTIDGNVTYMHDHIKNRPFFYFNKQMIDRFAVKAVPSVISQEGKKVIVKQIAMVSEK